MPLATVGQTNTIVLLHLPILVYTSWWITGTWQLTGVLMSFSHNQYDIYDKESKRRVSILQQNGTSSIFNWYSLILMGMEIKQKWTEELKTICFIHTIVIVTAHLVPRDIVKVTSSPQGKDSVNHPYLLSLINLKVTEDAKTGVTTT